MGTLNINFKRKKEKKESHSTAAGSMAKLHAEQIRGFKMMKPFDQLVQAVMLNYLLKFYAEQFGLLPTYVAI